MISRNTSSRLFAALAFVGAFSQLATAAPSVEKRDIFVPPVIDPHAGTVWVKGQTQTVTWDVSNPPANVTNKVGLIFLRKGGSSTPLILADGFDLLSGHVDVTVPWVFEGDDYSIVLVGDSGNDSQDFTIKQE